MNWTCPAVAAALLLCGCAGAPSKRPASRQPVNGSPAAAGSLPPGGARDGGHVGACRDGDCEVTVHGGTRIPLSPRFGIGPITVTVDGEDVGLRSHTAETDTNDTVTAPGTVTLNDVVVDVIDAHDDVATLRISHR